MIVGNIDSYILMVISIYVQQCLCSPNIEPKACWNKFEYEYNVLQKLVELEERIEKLSVTNNEQNLELKGAKDSIDKLKNKIKITERSLDGSTYTRWGRMVCPKGASLVYDGYAAGGYYKHSGSGVNYLCLPKDPIWGKYMEGFQSADRIYGAEYSTADYPHAKNLNYQDVPCAVCRIPRNNVLMVPGRNICHKDYILEYSGYLMGGHYSHAGASEYVCVDDDPELLNAGRVGRNEKHFYYVQAACGVLKCPPYADTRELTCAVCSFSPSTSMKDVDRDVNTTRI